MRFHHIRCVASQCGHPQSLSVWSSLDPKAKDVGTAQLEAAQSNSALAMHVDASIPDVAMNGQTQQGPGSCSNGRHLQGMNFWDHVSWRDLHDPVSTLA